MIPWFVAAVSGLVGALVALWYRGKWLDERGARRLANVEAAAAIRAAQLANAAQAAAEARAERLAKVAVASGAEAARREAAAVLGAGDPAVGGDHLAGVLGSARARTGELTDRAAGPEVPGDGAAGNAGGGGRKG